MARADGGNSQGNPVKEVMEVTVSRGGKPLAWTALRPGASLGRRGSSASYSLPGQ